MSQLMDTLRSFEKTPDCVGLELRLDLATIICARLKKRRWSMTRLAKKSGLKLAHLEQIVCSNVDVSMDTAGRILHALGTGGELVPLARGATRHAWIS